VSTLAAVKPYLPPRLVTWARCVLRGLPIPRWGNMRRVEPFSSCYGFDRGTPIDRYYLDHFLRQHSGDIRGTVLEVQMPAYVRRFGREVLAVDTIDILPDHGATYTCDLAESEGIVPSERYDCFLLPNTLSVLRRLDECLEHALRVIKPGGVVLATSAVIGQIGADADYWRLSAAGWREVAARVWPDCDVAITTYGNSLAATAAVQGLAAEELSARELDVRDERFPVLTGVCCRKPFRA
jgi:hypothetical protein